MNSVIRAFGTVGGLVQSVGGFDPGLPTSLPPFSSEGPVSINPTMLEEISSISEGGGLYRTAGVANNLVTTLPSVRNGFWYMSSAPTVTGNVPWFSGSYGIGARSGINIVSLKTGEYIRVHPTTGLNAQVAVLASMICKWYEPGTIVVHYQIGTELTTDLQNMYRGSAQKVVSGAFFDAGIAIYDYVGACYSNSSSTAFRAKTPLKGVILQF